MEEEEEALPETFWGPNGREGRSGKWGGSKKERS